MHCLIVSTYSRIALCECIYGCSVSVFQPMMSVLLHWIG